MAEMFILINCLRSIDILIMEEEHTVKFVTHSKGYKANEQATMYSDHNGGAG